MAMNASPCPLVRAVRLGSLVAASQLLFFVPAIAAQDDDNDAHAARIHSGTRD